MENEYISKDRLREIIGDVNEVCPYKVPGDYDTYSHYNEGWQDACNTIERMIDAEDGTEMVPLDYHERCLELEVERRIRAERPNRVLTLEEALKSEEPVWFERNGRLEISELILAEDPRFVEILSVGVYGPMLLKCADYNKTWRCWLRRPTAEEMAKEAWQNGLS